MKKKNERPLNGEREEEEEESLEESKRVKDRD